MEGKEILNIIAAFVLISTLVFALIMRIKLGEVKTKKVEHVRRFRRNSIWIAVIVVIFLAYWFKFIMDEKWIEEGIVGWRAYGVIIAIFMGIASLGFLIFGQIRKNRK